MVSHVTTSYPTLYIQEFNVCGCEGVDIFGDPVRIEKSQGILGLTLKICQAKADEDEKGSNRDGDEVDDVDGNLDVASVGSREQSQASGLLLGQRNGLNPASQEMYSTQIPNDLVPRQHKTTEFTDNHRPSDEHYLLSHLPSKNGNPAKSASRAPSHHPSQTPAPEGADPTTNTKSTPTTAPGRSRISGEQSSSRQPTNCQDRRSEQSDARSVSAGTSRDKLGSRSGSQNIGTKSKNGEDAASNRSSAPRNESMNQETSYSKTSLDPTQQKDVSSMDKQATGSPANLNKTHCGSDERGQRVASKDRTNDVWKYWKRIRRRDVMIPQDQEELIESPDSWVPPEAGKRMPQAHIPVGLLKQWNEIQAKRLSTRTVAPTEQVRTDELPSESSTSSSSSSAVEIGHEDWPPSPTGRNDDIVPADSSPPTFSRDRLRNASRPNVSEGQGEVDSSNVIVHQNENDANVSRDTPLAKRFARDLPPATQGTDGAESEMEISVPKGSGTMSSQEHHNTIGDGPPNAAVPLPSTEETGRNSARQSRPDPPSRPQSSRRSGNGGVEKTVLTPDDEPNQIPSGVLVPATYGSGDIPSQPRASGWTQPDKSQDSTSADEDKAVEKQLTSELDSFSSSVHMPGQHDPFKTGVTLSKNRDDSMQATDKDAVVCDAADAEESQVTATPACNKRKLDDSESARPAKLRRVTEEPVAHSRGTTRHSVERKSLGAENRQPYFSGDIAGSAGQAIYNSFKNAYPNYEGDIKTFKRSCRNLQLLCAERNLKRTLLWDDYVGRERTEYRGYLRECLQQNKSPGPYKTYFVNNVTVPRFKMRNLSAKRVAAIVDDNEIDDGEESESHASNANRHSSPDQHPLQDNSRSGQEPNTEVDNPPRTDHVAEYPGSEHRASGAACENIDGEDSDETESTEWYECDETHETASIELGDADNDWRAAVNDKEKTHSGDGDINMEDEETVVVRDEEARAHTEDTDHGASKRPSKYKDVIEIEESDTDTVVHTGVTEASPRKHEARKVRSASDKRQEKSTRTEESQKRDSQPDVEGPLYPPYNPPSGPAKNTLEQRERKSNRQPWWKDPKTPFKDFARLYAGLKDELGRFRRTSDTQWPPVDGDGVIIPKEMGSTRPGDSTEGGMETMGWHL